MFKKIIMWVLIVVFILFAALFLMRNILVKVIATKAVESITGLKLEVERIDVGVFRTRVAIKNLKLANPKEFSEPLMLDAPEIFVDYDLLSILKGDIHLKVLRFNLNQLVVLKRQAKMNVGSLKSFLGDNNGPAPKVRIDLLELKVGRVVYKDYGFGESSPKINEFNLNLNERFENVTDPNKLIGQLFFKVLGRIDVSKLVNKEAGALKNKSQELIQSVVSTTSETIGGAKGAISDLGNKTEKIFGDSLGSLLNNTRGN